MVFPAAVGAALLLLLVADYPPPVQLTAEQDHQRLLDELHIQSLRPGADPNHLDAPNAVNYDEAKVKPFQLPNALVMQDDRKVTTPAMWWQERRPELFRLFDDSMYGHIPANLPPVSWEVLSSSKETNGGVPVIVKKLAGHVDNSSYPAITVTIDLTLTTPAAAKGPVPVVMELAFVFPAGFKFPKNFHPPVETGPTWQQQILAKGWGYASLIPTSYQADNGAGLTAGIIGLANKGQPRKPGDWGALRAWAWGASRALDYFGTDPSVDPKRVVIEGLSRFGKAALVTMAYDQRFAIGFIGSSGEAGAKLSRRNFGELVENVAGAGEYHWMAGNFMRYAGPLTASDLPVDAHELIALCAPRPVFVSCGSQSVEGGWVDSKGQFDAEAGAGPVYSLLGKRPLPTSEMPPIGTALLDGDLAFRQHEGGHTTGPNWPYFLQFASRYFSAG